jgi:hypothetical protein
MPIPPRKWVATNRTTSVIIKAMAAASIKVGFRVATSIKEEVFEGTVSEDGEMARDGTDVL